MGTGRANIHTRCLPSAPLATHTRHTPEAVGHLPPVAAASADLTVVGWAAEGAVAQRLCMRQLGHTPEGQGRGGRRVALVPRAYTPTGGRELVLTVQVDGIQLAPPYDSGGMAEGLCGGMQGEAWPGHRLALWGCIWRAPSQSHPTQKHAERGSGPMCSMPCAGQGGQSLSHPTQDAVS